MAGPWGGIDEQQEQCNDGAAPARLRRNYSCPEDLLVHEKAVSQKARSVEVDRVDATTTDRSWSAEGGFVSEDLSMSPASIRDEPDMSPQGFTNQASAKYQQQQQPEDSQAPTNSLGPRSGNRVSWKRRIASKTSVYLRGIPFNTTEEEVLSFIDIAGASRYLAPVQPVELISNKQGRPSGFAEIRLAREKDIAELRERLHLQDFGGRYIEVLMPRTLRCSCRR